MASTKEIRSKISSIKKTQKITNAMQMVAASKMRKTQTRMEVSQPYARKIQEVMSHVAASHTEYRNPFLQPREDVRRVGYIIISTDRGLCGGLNINLFKKVLTEIRDWQSKESVVDLCLLGNKAYSFFKRLDLNVVASLQRIGETPAVADLIGSIRVMLESYREGKLDRLFIAYNSFVNKMVHKPTVMQLLPLTIDGSNSKAPGGLWDYIYETEPKIILNTLISRYLETEIYQAVVENVACEQAARMIAMKSATENAEEILDEMQIIYNKVRQAAITQEIAEIIGGAEAIG
jgi:F-type H+-transporting ATPase subunit gamma